MHSFQICFIGLQALKDYIKYPIVVDPGSNLSLCYNFTGVQQPNVPSMSLQLFGYNSTAIVDFPLFFRNLFLSFGTLNGMAWCLAMRYREGSVVNIIGNIAQGDHYIETDLVNKKIGWASRDCTLPI
jgi:hypothetical protein